MSILFKTLGFGFKFIPMMSMGLSWVCSRSIRCHLWSTQASGDIRHLLVYTFQRFSCIYCFFFSFLVIWHAALCNHIRLFRWNCVWYPPPHFYLIKYIFPDLYMKYITDYFKSYFFKIMPMHVSLCLRKCFKN